MLLNVFYFFQEAVTAAPREMPAEAVISSAVQYLRLAVETIGATIVAAGIAVAAYNFLLAIWRRETKDYNGIRLILARYLALALEFQLGADILSTAIAPSWEQIGKLGAIAVIRTGLNYFLMREMEQEKTKTTPAEPPN